MMGVSIDLGRRFGLVEPDLTKARKKGVPDSGLDYRAYNAAHPTSTQKDSRGRWTDNPVGQAIGQAISNVMARRGVTLDPDGTLVHLSDIRAEVGDRVPRGELDVELRRLSNAPGSGFLLIPQSNRKILTEEQRAGAVRIGGEDRELVSVTARDLPKPSKQESGIKYDPAFKMDPSPLSPSAEPWKAARVNLTRQISETADSDLSDWEDSDLAALRANAATLVAAVDGEQKRRKATKPARPKATARVKAKPELDFDALAADLRALPLVPESRDEVSRRLGALTIPELRGLGSTIDHPLPSKARKAELVSALSERIIGARLTTDAVMHYGDLDRFDRRRAEAGGVSGLERLMGGKWDKPDAPGKPMQEQVRDAHAGLQRYPGDWVPLADLREKLGGTREEQDAALKEMATQPGIYIIPWDNRKALRQRDHDASLRFGGEDNHAIRIEQAPAPAKVTARPRKPRAEDTGQDVSAIAGRIQALDVDDAEAAAKVRAMVEKLRVAQMKELAGKLGPTVSARGRSRAQLVHDIVEGTVGFRQRSRAIGSGEDLWGGGRPSAPPTGTSAARTVMGTKMSLPMQQALVKVEDSGGLEMRRAEFIHDHKLSEREFDLLVDNGFLEEDELAGLGFIGITPRGEQAIKALRESEGRRGGGVPKADLDAKRQRLAHLEAMQRGEVPLAHGIDYVRQEVQDLRREIAAEEGGGGKDVRASGETLAVVDRLRSLTSVAEGRTLIGGKSKAELLAIAEAAGISRPSGKTKQELIESITYATITGPGSHAMLRRLGNQGKA